MALIGQFVSEKMFENYGYIHVYSPRTGADTPLRHNHLQLDVSSSQTACTIFASKKIKELVFYFYPVIPTFHWTAFPLRSWRSRSFSKIIPNRSRSVDSHTVWGLHASSTLALRFYYASVTLLPRCSRLCCVIIARLLRSRYDNEDTATLSLR